VEGRAAIGTVVEEAVRRVGAVGRSKRTMTNDAFIAVFRSMDCGFDVRDCQDGLRGEDNRVERKKSVR